MKSLSWGVRRSFYEQAEAQLDNGRTLTAVLADFHTRLKRRHYKGAAKIVDQIRLEVVDGGKLTAAMAASLTSLERSVLSAGEQGQGGRLPGAMRLILEVREMIDNITLKFISTFFAPAVYMVTLYATLWVIGSEVVPPLTGVLPVSKWTGWAYAMNLMGEAAIGWVAPFIFGSIVAYLIWSVRALPKWTGKGRLRGRAFCDRYVFPFSVYGELSGFTWLMSFVALLRAGVPETTALESQIATASPWLASRLTPILDGMKFGGLDMAAAMRRTGNNFPSQDLIDEVGAYIGAQSFADKLEVALRKYAKRLERALLFKGLLISGFFSLLMYFAFIVVALGSNTISSLMSSSMGN